MISHPRRSPLATHLDRRPTRSADAAWASMRCECPDSTSLLWNAVEQLARHAPLPKAVFIRLGRRLCGEVALILGEEPDGCRLKVGTFDETGWRELGLPWVRTRLSVMDRIRDTLIDHPGLSAFVEVHDEEDGPGPCSDQRTWRLTCDLLHVAGDPGDHHFVLSVDGRLEHLATGRIHRIQVREIALWHPDLDRLVLEHEAHGPAA